MNEKRTREERLLDREARMLGSEVEPLGSAIVAGVTIVVYRTRTSALNSPQTMVTTRMAAQARSGRHLASVIVGTEWEKIA